ncbi:hypothetical protein [Streptomyces sp. NPDC050355]
MRIEQIPCYSTPGCPGYVEVHFDHDVNGFEYELYRFICTCCGCG